MKTLFQILVLFISITLMSMSGCDPTPTPGPVGCEGYGYLEVENGSIKTIQVVIIDGTRYGSLSPGESKKFKLAEGKHSYQIASASSSGGCSAATVTIVECKTEGRICRL